jgi:hypothetical protein
MGVGREWDADLVALAAGEDLACVGAGVGLAAWPPALAPQPAVRHPAATAQISRSGTVAPPGPRDVRDGIDLGLGTAT